jgi:hypothetical protein
MADEVIIVQPVVPTIIVNPTIPEVTIASQGAQGERGPQGPSTIAVGTTTTTAAGTNASVTNVGTSADLILDFGVPRGNTGAQGAQGDAATINVGTTTTGAAGTPATVNNSGSTSAAVFNFTIPEGEQGIQGEAGIVAQTTAPVDTDILWLDTDEPAVAPATVSVTAPIVNTGTSTNANIGINLSNIAQKYANPWQIKYRSGYWYESRNAGVLSNAGATLNRLYLYPVFIQESITIDRLGMEVQTQAASSTIRLGIYNSDSNGDPLTLLLDAGTVSGTTTGLKAITVSQTLSTGLYYLAWVWQGAVGRTITYGATATSGNWAPVASTTQGPSAAYFAQYIYPGDNITGSLPLTWSGNSPTSAAATRIQWRIA